MKIRISSGVAALAMTFATAPVHAAGFDGATIESQIFAHDLGRATSSPQVAVVGPGVEFPTDEFNFYSIDAGGNSLTITDLFGGSFGWAPFNGLVISDADNSLPAITGITFTGGGFAGEQPTVTFDADHLYFSFNMINDFTAQGTPYYFTVIFGGGVP